MHAKGDIRLHRPLHPWEEALLEEGDLYLVGGIVRDLLSGKRYESLDEDYLVTGVGFDSLVASLDPFGATNLVGKSFGVVKFTSSEGATVDISLPRSEYSVGYGHRDFHVSFDPSIPVEEDLQRRDFTINSMALHLGNAGLVDPLGGRKDLEDRVLRVNREGSFREDPLRIVRGVQFLARFELTVDEATRQLMERDAKLLETVSAERVREELNKTILRAERPGIGFTFMHETGILEILLPELEETFGVEQNEYHPDDVFTHCVKSCDAAPADLVIRWSALLHDLGKKKMKREVGGRVVFYRHEEESARMAGEVLDRLRFPRGMTRRIVHLVRHHMYQMTDDWSDAAVRRFIARIGRENLEDLFAVNEADVRSRSDRSLLGRVEGARARVERILASEATFKREHLAVNGSDIIEHLGIEGGPRVGEILQALLDLVLENPEMNTRDRLLEAASELEGDR